MLIFNDFLKTRAGFAYVRECVKFGFDVADAVQRHHDLYKIEVTSYEIHGCMKTTNLTGFVSRLRSFDGRYTVHKYNVSTCEYDCVYDGSAEALHRWVVGGDIRITDYDGFEPVECLFNLYSIDTCAGNERKLVYSNALTFDVAYGSLSNVVEKVAINPHSWLVCHAPGSDTEVFRASAAFMRDVCGDILPF